MTEKFRENRGVFIGLNRLKKFQLYSMSQIVKQYKNQIISVQISLVFLFTPLFFYFDGQAFHAYFTRGQWVSNAILVVFFALFYWIGDRKVRYKLIIMAVISAFVEVWLSLGIELYVYRELNVPLYVPLGHGVIFISVYYLQKQAVIRWHSRKLIPLLYILIISLSSLSLIFLNDVFGFICFLVFLIFLHYKRSKLFYLLMFIMVLYLEVCGTIFKAWAWYGVLGNHLDYVSTANPPVGIAGLYMILDMLTNNIYLMIARFLKKTILKSFASNA